MATTKMEERNNKLIAQFIDGKHGGKGKIIAPLRVVKTI